MGNTKTLAGVGRGDRDRGNGLLRCVVCKKPYRDHLLTEPCPELGVGVGHRLTTARRRRASNIGDLKTEAETLHFADEKFDRDAYLAAQADMKAWDKAEKAKGMRAK